MKRWWLCAVLALGVGAPTEIEAFPARKPPSKPPPRRKNPPPHKKKKIVAPAEQVEDDLHSERLAVLGRFKELNESMRDAELAATIRRLDDLEAKRHGLALKLISRAKDQDKEEGPK